MYKTKIILILSIFPLVGMIFSIYSSSELVNNSDLIGYYFIDEEGVLFTLRIVEEGGELKGRHCWTDQLSVGEDCTPRNGRSLTNPEIINVNTVQFTFRTYYGMGAENESDYYGKVKLTLQDENTLLWEITEQPAGRAVIPDELTLERYHE